MAHRSRRLHLDARDCRGPALDDDVDLRAVLVAEVVEGHARVVPAGLPEELLKYERFQELAKKGAVVGERGTVQAEKRRCDSGVAKVELRSLDQPTDPVAVPGWKAFQQEDPLKQRRVVSNRGSADFEGRGQVTHIEDSGRLAGGRSEESRKDVELSNPREVKDIALDKGIDEVVVPVGASTSRWAGERGRIPTGGDATRQCGPQPLGALDREVAGEEGVEKVGPAAQQFALCQGVKPERLQSACQRLREPRHQKRVGGACQQEPSRGPLPVDLHLEGGEQRRCLLDLVQDDSPWEAGRETVWILLGGTADHVVVEGDIAVSPGRTHDPGERGLAALARSVYQDGRRVGERFHQVGLDEAGIDGGIDHRPNVTLMSAK